MVPKWVAIALVAVAICTVITLAAFRDDIAVAYHRRIMMRACAKIGEVGPNGNQMPWIESYEHHRDALVRCGYLARREFPLSVRPPGTSRVWKRVTAEFPDNIHAIMGTTEWGWTENKIIVWDRPDRIPAWETSIRKHDVSEATTGTSATSPAQE